MICQHSAPLDSHSVEEIGWNVPEFSSEHTCVYGSDEPVMVSVDPYTACMCGKMVSMAP